MPHAEGTDLGVGHRHISGLIIGGFVVKMI